VDRKIMVETRLPLAAGIVTSALIGVFLPAAAQATPPATSAGAQAPITAVAQSVSSTAVTKTFRQGDSSGSVVTDGGVNGATPDTNYATAGYIAVNVTSGGHALIRFDNLFGNEPHQIPYGSIITSARVSLYLSGVASGAGPAQMHRMLVPWQDTATYNSMTTSGPGIQHDDVEARLVADAYANVSVGGTKSFVVTSTVQDWANGAPVYGWTVWRNSTVNMNVTLSDNSVVPRRPLLSVTYTPPT
jgi:hypothetical protein